MVIRNVVMLSAALCAGLASTVASADTVAAKVVGVTPIVVQDTVPRTVDACRDIEQVVERKHTFWPSVGGALAGAAVGSRFGGGVGREIFTAAGASVGERVAVEHVRGHQEVVVKRVCGPAVQYDRTNTTRFLVTYELDGREFQTTLDRDPGRTIDISLQPSVH